MTDTEIIERAAHRAHDRRGHHLMWTFGGVVLVGLVLLGVAFFSYRNEHDRAVAELAARADDNADAARALAEQVEQLGGDPVVDPPAGEPGADGAPGRDGQDGRNGRDGRDGRDGQVGQAGQDGTDGEDGATPPCMTESTQCRGADGQDGRAGQDGPPGPPPAGWRWTDVDGREQSCTRTGGTDTAPTYDCTAEPPPETVPGLPLPIGG